MPKQDLTRLHTAIPAACLAAACLAAPALAAIETRNTLVVKLQREFPAHDLDRNGSISRAEFQTLMSRLATSRGQTNARKVAEATDLWFRRADSDRNTRITPTEANVLLQAYYARYDADRDGRLSDAEQMSAADLIVQGR